MGDPTDSGSAPLKFESLGVHAGLSRSENEIKDAAIYASTSFVFNDSAHGAAIFGMNAEAFCYSRIANPTVDVFEKRISALENGAAALATVSGQAAIFTTITALAQLGSNIVVASSVSQVASDIFRYRLPPLGITARFVENGDIEAIVAAIDKDTKFVFVESIPTDTLQVSDIEAIASAAHGAGVPLVVDNTAGAGGYLVRPIDDGADIVVQTAFWLGISSSNSGVIIDSGKFPWNANAKRFPQFFEPSPGFHGLRIFDKFANLSFISFARVAVMRDTGPCMNPLEAFQLISGLETLSVRLQRHSSNALELASWLQMNGKVKQVHHPGPPIHQSSFVLTKKFLQQGYGGLLAVSLNTGQELSSDLLNKAKVVSIAQSAGGTRTVIIADTRESDKRLLISVGLENIDDIITDFDQLLS